MMPLRRLPLALCLMLCACASTQPPGAPSKIPPPPVMATLRCPAPETLGEGVTADQLVDWAAGWVKAAGCEHTRRQALLKAWPK